MGDSVAGGEEIEDRWREHIPLFMKVFSFIGGPLHYPILRDLGKDEMRNL